MTYNTLGKDGCEDYEGNWGDVPLQYMKTASERQALEQYADPSKNVSAEEMKQMDKQIQKALDNHDIEVVAVMKEVRKMLAEIGGAT